MNFQAEPPHIRVLPTPPRGSGWNDQCSARVFWAKMESDYLIEKYFGFVVDKFFELVHTIKSLCSRQTGWLWFGPLVRNSQNLDGNFHAHLPEVFEFCLELLSKSGNQFGFVVHEFSELEHTIESLALFLAYRPKVTA